MNRTPQSQNLLDQSLLVALSVQPRRTAGEFELFTTFDGLLDLHGEFDGRYRVFDVTLTGTDISIGQHFTADQLRAFGLFCDSTLPSEAERDAAEVEQARCEARSSRPDYELLGVGA